MVTLGSDIEVNVKATNIGGTMDAFFFVPISANRRTCRTASTAARTR